MTYLKFHRYRAGLSQGKIAKRIGISQGYYCEIERGEKRPGPTLIDKMSRAIGRPKEELLGKLYGVNPCDMITSPIPTEAVAATS